MKPLTSFIRYALSSKTGLAYLPSRGELTTISNETSLAHLKAKNKDLVLLVAPRAQSETKTEAYVPKTLKTKT